MKIMQAVVLVPVLTEEKVEGIVPRLLSIILPQLQAYDF
jgi:hypothetical protein